MATSTDPPLIGVLALQGSVAEHVEILESRGARTRQIRVASEVAGVDGLVLPGGESTAIAIMTEGDGIFAALRAAVDGGLPAYGTCAGLILLADDAVATKKGAPQALVGGLDCTVCRNYFGSQVSSFETELRGEGAFSAVFIRAPAILRCGAGVEALATVSAAPCAAARDAVDAFDAKAASGAKRPRDGGAGSRDVVVAARQGNVLVTAFHPELTEDARWHDKFLAMVEAHRGGGGAAPPAAKAPPSDAPSPADVEAMTVGKLKIALARAGCEDASGKKADLKARLLAALA